MNEMQVFNYEGNKVRTVTKDGEPWWVLTDVCRVLSIKNNRDASRRLDEDEKGVGQIDTLGGGQKMTIINESGLYKIILRSDKPEAKKFTRWVTHEVLPTIRKTGGYGTQTATMDRLLDKLVQVTANLTQAVTTMATVMEQMRPVSGETISLNEAPLPVVGFNNTRCKLESFPPQIVRKVEEMLVDMQEQQNLNFSMIARFCTINGYAISSPAVKTYYQRHFSE